jgi:Domain of unknown function DUF11/Beta-propeller repeat
VRLSRRRSGNTGSAPRVLGAIALLSLLASAALGLASVSNRFGIATRARNAGILPFRAQPAPATSVLAAYGHLPLVFESNQGQSDARVKFLARGAVYGLFLTTDSAVLTLQHSTATAEHSVETSPLSMTLVNRNPHVQVRGEDQLPGRSNYFIGNDPAKWHRDIPQFARVRYASLYPGIDLIFYGNRGRLEYDFEVAPGSDPTRVVLKFQGAKILTIDPAGDLVLSMSGGDIRLQTPSIYQKIGEDVERAVQGRFELRGEDEVGFALGEYDRTRKLVIDPVLIYSTYLGGSSDEGCSAILGTGTPVSGCPAVAVDSASNAYIAGSTKSADFPTVSPYQSKNGGTANIFVAKFNQAGNTLLFSTYLGGNGTDYTAGVGVDSGTNVIVAGTTSSGNFPTKNAYQTTRSNGNNHVFVSKLDPTGHSLLYSTYLSGNGTDTATGVTVGQSDQNAYITGITTSTNTPTSISAFPATLGSFQTAPASGSTIQFFMSKVNPNLSGNSSLAYSTYFGGGNPSTGVATGGGIAVDINNNVYITGGTNFLHVGGANDFPILNAYQACLDAAPSTTTCPTNVTATDAFVAWFNPNATTGSQLLYSTYLGGTGTDVGDGIATDGTSAYVTGSTTSTDFSVAGTGVFQPANGGGTDAFLAKLANPVTTGNTPGSVTLSYFTYLGGPGTDIGLAVAVDSIQGARLTGWTNSPAIPQLNSNVQAGYAGANDAFVARIDTTAATSNAQGHYFTYLGGTGADYGTSIAVDPQGASYVAGQTNSQDFLRTAIPQSPAFQPNLAGATDAFLSKLGPLLTLTLTGDSSPPMVGVGNQVSFEYTITNSGDAANNIIFTDSLPSSGASFTSATASSGSCGSATGNVVSCTIGTLNAGASSTATVVLTPTASTTPSTTALTLGNTAFVTAQGCSTCTQSFTTSAVVNDYNISVSPSTATVPAGVPATYTATITPTGNIPESVSISCSSGLPTGATCTETTNPFPNLSSGRVSTVLVINTTARVTTTTELRKRGQGFDGVWLPLSGLTLLGMGFGASRKRRLLMLLLFAGFFGLTFLQPGCGSTAPVSTTSGTPAGTYLVTVTATSGSATRNATVTLVVQ